MRTQKEMFQLTRMRNEVLTAYLHFCIKEKQVPKEEMVVLINSCESIVALEITKKRIDIDLK